MVQCNSLPKRCPSSDFFPYFFSKFSKNPPTMKFFCCCFLLLVSLPSFLSAGFFHVAMGGDDQNNGSAGTPWATMNHALSQVGPGDTVYVETGIYSEKVSFSSSGTAGNPIVLLGDTVSPALIDGNALSPVGREGLISIVNHSYIHVVNFELANFRTSTTDTPVGILVEGNSHDIQIRDCILMGIDHTGTTNDRGANAIGIYGTDANGAIYNLLLQGNEISQCSTLASEVVTLNGNVRNFEVVSNRVHDCTNIGMDFIGWEGECSGCTATSGPNVDRARNGIVRDNLIFNIDTKDNPAYGGERNAAGLYVDGGADIIFDRNIVHTSNIGVELASETFGRATERIVVRNHLIYNNHLIGISTGGYDPGTGPGGGSAEQCWVVQNTLYQNHSSTRPQDDFDGEIRLQYRNVDMMFANNIVVADTNRPRVVIDGPNQAFSFSNMAYWGSSDGQAPGAVVTSDPEFVNGPFYFFALQPSSLCIDGGMALPDSIAGTEDYAGDPRLLGNGLDIGAYEYPLPLSRPLPDGADYSVNLFPNPTADILHLQWFFPGPAPKLSLFNSTGQQLSFSPLKTGPQSLEIDVSKFPAGIYWIRMEGKDGGIVRRWVKG